MISPTPLPATVVDYIDQFPPKIRAILRRVRTTIRKAAPDAEERLAYRMPCYELHGALMYFGGFKEHVGLYPPVRDPLLVQRAAEYAGIKGNLRFRYDEAIPYELIADIVTGRVRENLARRASRSTKGQRATAD